jgi:hypothetical protein
MRRKIYTKKESILFEPDILGLIVVVFFCAVMTNVDQNNGVFYLMYLILIGLWIWKTVEALHSRKKHKKCVETQIPQKGQIVDCICETIYHRRARGSYTEYRYYLIVEMYIQGLSTPVTVQSDAYPWPVYQALSSPEVDVYYSDTESGYTLDAFQYKSDKSESDILPELLRKSLPSKGIESWFIVIIFLLMLLTVRYRYG